MLALTNPVAFGRARRLQKLALGLARSLGYADFWQLEAAAMLSQIGYISIPVELSEKIYYGEPLNADEKILAGAVNNVSLQLLDRVPRLEPVMQVLMALDYNDAQLARLGDGTVGLATRILGLVLEYDTLTIRGSSAESAMQLLRARRDRYGPELIDQFAVHVGVRGGQAEIREMVLKSVLPGMTIMADVRTHMGTLLVPRGFEVTPRFLDRIANFGAQILEERVPVLVSGALS